jgi:hypothetical protein
MNTWLACARVGARVAAAAAILCGAESATAGELDYQLSLGVGHSDNVNQDPIAEVDQDIATAGLEFSFDQDSAKLRADVVGDLAYYKYLDDAYDPDLVGTVDANALFALVPDRITWALSDEFGQALTDPFQSDTPNNRENINYFSTGPDFIMGLGPQMRLRIGARYALADYEVTPFDSTTTGAQLALQRVLSDRSSVSLNGNLEQVEYDEASLNADFDHSELFVHYEGAGARTNLEVDVGYSQLDRDVSDDTEGGAVFRVDASRKMSSSSTLLLVGGHEFGTSASLPNDYGDVGIATAPGQQSADPFLRDHASLGWTFNRNLTSVGVAAYWEQNTHDDNASLDQTMTMFSATYRRDMSPTTSLQLNVARTGVQYEEPSPDYDELIAGASFSWRLSRNLTLDVNYDFAVRHSDDPTTEYTENRFWLAIGFGRGVPRATRVAPTFGVDSPGN